MHTPPFEPDRPVCFGVSWWNRKSIATLLGLPRSRGVFFDTFTAALAAARMGNGVLVAWASKLSQQQEVTARYHNVTIVRIEDGFIRSVGLGAGLTSGNAYALDARGIYYDAGRPSDLEHMLQTRAVTPTECARARELSHRIRAARITKYNIGHRGRRPSLPGRRILVPGQVSTDASVTHMASNTALSNGMSNPNLQLLSAVRKRNPDASIIYKPHPDVVAGLRPGTIARDDALRFADHIEAGMDVVDLIDFVDSVETLSSLTGFEALLRGREVVVHGQPFYAGWGLTEDLTPVPRRTRKRTIDELVFISLCEYCRYVDPVSQRPCTIEAHITRLQAQRTQRTHQLRVGACQHLSRWGRHLGL
jgi:capsular polysaccharide export protein